MQPEVVNGEVEAIFESTDDFEVLFAALDHAKRVMQLRKWFAIRSLSRHVLSVAQYKFDGEAQPVLIEGKDLRLVEDSLRLYAETAYDNINEASQAQRHMQAHAFNVLDELDAARAGTS